MITPTLMVPPPPLVSSFTKDGGATMSPVILWDEDEETHR